MRDCLFRKVAIEVDIFAAMPNLVETTSGIVMTIIDTYLGGR